MSEENLLREQGKKISEIAVAFGISDSVSWKNVHMLQV